MITEIVACITEAADELLFLENRNEIQQGQLLDYAESLSIIRDALAGYDLTTVGLDFDTDERYLKRYGAFREGKDLETRQKN